MKLGIVGTGNVGRAIALAAATRGSAREIVLVNRTSTPADRARALEHLGLVAEATGKLLERRELSVPLRIVLARVHEHADPPHGLGLLRPRAE